MSHLLIIDDDDIDAKRLKYELEDALGVPVRYRRTLPTPELLAECFAVLVDVRHNGPLDGDAIAKAIADTRPDLPLAFASYMDETYARKQYDLGGRPFYQKDCDPWWDDIEAFVLDARAQEDE